MYWAILRTYAPYITLPFAGVVGFIGYHVEGWISNKQTRAAAPIKQQRQERLLANLDSNMTVGKHKPLEVNLSPSLSS